jgi:hypothetical protein
MATITDTAAQTRWEKEAAAAPPREQPPTIVKTSVSQPDLLKVA